jgi:transporter family protein
MLADWLVPTAYYVVALGALGVVSKLALRCLTWQALVVWMGIGYVVLAVILLALGDLRLTLNADTWWAALAALLAVIGLVTLYLALGAGDASKVVPVSAGYPAVTLLLSAIVLSESVTIAGVAGMVLVVGGVAILTAAR